MITLLKIGVEVEGDRSHVLISLVGQVSTNTIRRQVYRGVIDAKSTSTVGGRLPVAMLFKLVDYQSPLSFDTWSIRWSILGYHLNHYIAIDSWQPAGGLSVVYVYRLTVVLLEWQPSPSSFAFFTRDTKEEFQRVRERKLIFE